MSPNVIYVLSDPRTGDVRYVGKSTSGLRRPRSHSRWARSRNDRTHKSTWIRSLSREGFEPKIEIVEEFHSSAPLNDAEKFYISYFRFLGFDLTNHTDGGEGQTGLRHTAETKRKMARSHQSEQNITLEQEVVDMYRSGASARSIALKIKMSYGFIIKSLKRNGVSRRSRSQAATMNWEIR